MPKNPITAYNELLAHPKTFLSKYPIRIAGSDVPSSVVQYYIYNWDFGRSKRPDSVLRTLYMHDTEAFRIDACTPTGHPFRAHSIEMVQSNITTGISFYTLPNTGGPDIMVTGVLSGCTFLVDAGPAPGSIMCAHLQPNGETGAMLNARLLGLHAAVYGRNNYGHLHDPANPGSFDRSVTIVGVRRNGQWKVYAQKLDGFASWSVRSAHRIYPA